MVPEARIELARSITPRDFKSLASTYSATRAFVLFSRIPEDLSEAWWNPSTGRKWF